MKRILGITVVFGLMGVLTLIIGCSRGTSGIVTVIDLGKGVKLEMVLIPSGKFMMGSPPSEKGRRDDKKQHEIKLTEPFYIGRYEVTQEQWESVMDNNPSSKTKGARLPVTDVSWGDCQEFVKMLNMKTNGGYRLPREVEWEYACRARTTIAYSVGDSLKESDANIDSSSIKTVGSYKANTFGLYDMHGNVWEWCEDWKVSYQAGADLGKHRVLRGGSFLADESLARSSLRNDLLSPDDRAFNFGFRLAKTP